MRRFRKPSSDEKVKKISMSIGHDVYACVQKHAEEERRSWSNMIEILACEALQVRHKERHDTDRNFSECRACWDKDYPNQSLPSVKHK